MVKRDRDAQAKVSGTFAWWTYLEDGGLWLGARPLVGRCLLPRLDGAWAALGTHGQDIFARTVRACIVKGAEREKSPKIDAIHRVRVHGMVEHRLPV